jgi:N-acyl-D-aspartate/D-glutamate deacylase
MSMARIIAAGFAALLLQTATATAVAATFDVVLRGGTVIDGTGKPGRVADVGIRGDRIGSIGNITESAAVTIDAKGLVVAPGFIDMHNHSDGMRLIDPHGPSYALQGVTTEVWGEHVSMGPYGGKVQRPNELSGERAPTWKTLGEFLETVEKHGSAANFCSFVASGTLRAYVVGYDNREATAAEIEQEEQLVRQAMSEGALGLSSGLSYVPNIYMSTAELTALAREAGAAGGIYATHARTINGQDPGALREAIGIGEHAHLPVHFFHLNSIASWSAPAFLRIIAEARQRGLEVTADAYPYTWGITGLADYLPSWALAGGRDAMLARLRDPEQRRRISRGFMTDPPHYATIGWQNVRLGVNDPRVNARLVTEVAASRQVTPEDAYMDVVLEQEGEGIIIDLNNHEDTLQLVMRQPFVSVGSDGRIVDLAAPDLAPLLHPRQLGTFPRWLGHYARDLKLMSLEETIRRMTSFAAATLRLRDRGVLEVGKFADIVVFDPQKITDRATFEDPKHYSEGVRHLFVNGMAVVSDGKTTQALPGRALRGPGYKAAH